MRFQAVDWQETDINFKLVIKVYGRTNDGDSVCVHINGFEPFFYVKLPNDASRHDLSKIRDYLENDITDGGMGEKMIESLVGIELVKMHDLYWFSNNKLYKFAKLTFSSLMGFMKARSIFEGKIEDETDEDNIVFINDIGDESTRKNNRRFLSVGGFNLTLGKSNTNWNSKRNLYESKLTPLLRFFHIKDIQPSGWIELKRPVISDTIRSTCKFDYTCNWKEIKFIDITEIAPLRILSYDIETNSSTGEFPKATIPGDAIIQIGLTCHRYGEKSCYKKVIITLKDCLPIEGATVVSVKTEYELIMKYAEFVRYLDPDIITGYNIWTFDDKYLFERAHHGYNYPFKPRPKYHREFLEKMTKNKTKPAKYVYQELKSSAMGDNEFYYILGEGIINIDLLKYVRDTNKLDSYKLDNVSKEIIRSNITKMELLDDNKCKFYTTDVSYLQKDTWISINPTIPRNKRHLINKDKIKAKYQIQEINELGKYIIVKDFNPNECITDPNLSNDMIMGKIKNVWFQNKVDLPPFKLFEHFNKGNPEDIHLIAVYCLKDCELVNYLTMKLEVIGNNIGMSNVCLVPFSYLFTRGQGIKIFSLVAKYCADRKYCVKTRRASEMPTDKYEGAIVFFPTPGIYFEPVAVMDYASLYPSSMIAENISHETLVCIRDYDKSGELINESGRTKLLNLPNYQYNEIKYNNYALDDITKEKVLVGHKVCIYAEKPGEKGLMPQILERLLFARRVTRASAGYYCGIHKKTGEEIIGFYEFDSERKKHIFTKYKEEPIEYNEDEIIDIKEKYTEFQKIILDGLQLAYKVVCNSLYGQLGATTSPICFKELAASTTAVGRQMVLTARDLTLEKYPKSKLIYGDTDSVFISFKDYIIEKHGKVEEMELLQKTIDYGIEAGNYITSHLKKPQELEYEKTFYPFTIFTKKRYFGNKYEKNIKKYSQTYMGIALKRRDYCPLVKDIYQGIMNEILEHRNIEKAKEFYIKEISNLLSGKVDIDMLMLSKTLKRNYSDPRKMMHKVLAERMGERDLGSKPQVNERVQFMFIDPNNLRCQHPNCKNRIDQSNCKCRICIKLFCKKHIDNHEKTFKCIPRCQFTHISNDNEELKYCKTCGCYFTYESYKMHMLRRNVAREIFYDKCKKLLSRKLLQGDLVEDPSYIKKYNIKIDYMRYFQNQIKEPVQQIFSLVMKNPNILTHEIEQKYYNELCGQTNISAFFSKLKKI